MIVRGIRVYSIIGCFWGCNLYTKKYHRTIMEIRHENRNKWVRGVTLPAMYNLFFVCEVILWPLSMFDKLNQAD